MTNAQRSIWKQRPRLAEAWLADCYRFAASRLPRTGPIVGDTGVFVSVGHPPRWKARGPNCGSRERQRLLHQWTLQGRGNRLKGKRIGRVAPEKITTPQMRGNPLYETADLRQSGVTHQVDIAHVDLPDASHDVVMASHVLEHIAADRMAMREIYYRPLMPGGVALRSVPVNTSRQETYENPAITAPAERNAHFSAADRVRYDGLDPADRLRAAGFAVETFRMTPEEEVQYGSLREEWLYVGSKKPLAPVAGEVDAGEGRR